MTWKLPPIAIAAGALWLCGCQTYTYRIVQPVATPSIIGDQPVVVRIEPLEYRLDQDQGHLSLRVLNSTSDQIALLNNRSYVTDPAGESHPIRGRVLGPRTFIRMLLPPIPFSIQHPDYTLGWGWGGYAWGWGWPGYVPMSGPYYADGFWGPPPIVYDQEWTIYDWSWKRGKVRLHLTYERGKETFEHEFEFDREPNQ